ncbi:hypothetical protein V8C37DRAFT_406856 [Trichoderma ceciliae]
MHEKGSHIFRLAQTRKSCLSIIQHTLSFNSTIVLKLQNKIVNQGRQIKDTKAGMQLNNNIIRKRKKYKDNMEQLNHKQKEVLELQAKEYTDRKIRYTNGDNVMIHHFTMQLGMEKQMWLSYFLME